jgi:hypothetical protein
MHHTVVEKREAKPSSKISLWRLGRKAIISATVICVKVYKGSVLLAARAHTHDTCRQLFKQNLLVQLRGTAA